MSDDYAIDCENCGIIPLSAEQYDAQMNEPNVRWKCPKCGATPVDIIEPDEYDDESEDLDEC